MRVLLGEEAIADNSTSVSPFLRTQQETAELLQAHDGLPDAPSTISEPVELVSEWGFRNGLCELGDTDNVVKLTDKQEALDTLFPILGSAIMTGGLGNDNIAITANYHCHAVRDSIIDMGGGSDTIAITSGGAWLKDSPVASASTPSTYSTYSYDHTGREAGYGFGMVDSSLFATGSGGSHITINARVCGVMGAASEDATSITTGDGDDEIAIKADHRAMHDASIYSGDGNDLVVLTARYDTIVHGSAIHLGAGNDTLQIRHSEKFFWDEAYTHEKYMLDQSVVLTGTGNDLIDISHGNNDSGEYAGLVHDSYFLLGSGNDTLSLNASTGGGMYASEVLLENYDEDAGNKTLLMRSTHTDTLLESSVISLGNGNDSIDLYQYYFQKDYSTPGTVLDSWIATGEGNDTIRITLEEFETQHHYVVANSSINSGSGNDEIYISSSSDVLYNASIEAGLGNDLLWVASHGRNNHTAALDSTISMGEGDDTLIMQGWVSNTTISTGDGADHISMVSYGQENPWSYTGLVSNSSILLGGGSDTIDISSEVVGVADSTIKCDETGTDTVGSKAINVSSESYAFQNSTVELESGNDSLWLSGTNSALVNSTIDTGGGHDYMNISAESAIAGSTIQMGEGDDTLHIVGNSGENSNVDLGDGDDLFILKDGELEFNFTLDGGDNRELDFSSGKLGDILSLTNNNLSSFLDNDNGNQISGFEALHVDFKNEEDSLVLDDLLARISGSNCNGGRFDSIIITGDYSSDSIKMDNAQLNVSGVALEKSSYYGTFDWYTAYEGTDQQIEIYVATGMMAV